MEAGQKKARGTWGAPGLVVVGWGGCALRSAVFRGAGRWSPPGGGLAEAQVGDFGGEGVEYSLVGGVDFGRGEGFLRVAVEEGVGHGFAVGGDFFAGGVAEDVFEFAGDEEFLLGGFHGFEDGGVAQVGRDFHGGVAAGARELRQIGCFEGGGGDLLQFAQVEFGVVAFQRQAEFAAGG